MFDAAVSVDSVGAGGDGGVGGSRFGWREIHRALRRIAKSKGELDAEELRWLARAERAELHRELGMATMVEYAERILGYGPKVGRDRLRVARKLEKLPRIAVALEKGELPFSAVRELSRFVVPETEQVWLEKARGKCLREIEDMSRGRKPGSRPEDPVDPETELRPVTLDLSPTTLAFFREATRRLEEEMGHALTDDEVIAAMCVTVLDASRGARPEAVEGDDDKPAPRVAPYQVALTICEYCDRACQDATGHSIDVPDSVVAMATCDAQYIGNVTCEAPERSWQEIPPATARIVLRRDRGRCQVPGCRSSRFIHIHHVVHREHGGTNQPSNLVCLCFGHHQSLHRNQIALTGVAPDALVFDLTRFEDPPS